MRAAGRMTHFPPTEDTASCTLRLSRCHQAQLDQQRFAPPRGLAMPSASLQPAEHRAAELGVKVAAGFEILWARAARVGSLPGQVHDEEAAQSAGEGQPAASQPGEEGSLPQGAALTERQLEGLSARLAFKAALERRDYFEGNIAGSAR